MVEQLQQYLESQPIIAILISYVGGLLTSFTPCVFPVIPITIGVLGLRSSNSRTSALLHSIVYVLGMAFVYAALGMGAGLTGQFFGAVSVHPITNIVVGVICFVFGLYMFDIINIPLPSFLTNRNVDARKHHGFFGLFFMGAVSGTIVAPCTAPVLGTLLTYVGSTQSVLYGGVLLFAYAWGLGTLLIVLGTFSGLVTSVGKWQHVMAFVKKLLAFAMLLVAAYFIYRGGQFGGWW